MKDPGISIEDLVKILNSVIEPRTALRFCWQEFARDGELDRLKATLESLANDEQVEPGKRKIIRELLDEDYQPPEPVSW